MGADCIFLTGGGGFVGSALARLLVADGFAVRALVRRPRDDLEKLNILQFEGDIRDRAAVRHAMAGARYVFHVAADYRLWAPDPSEIFTSNLDGTRIVMEEALHAGAERIVHTSSVATLALNPDGTAADETRGLAEDEATGAYKKSKVAAERLVRRMAEHDSLPVVIVNPSTPIGPRDARPTPTGRIIVEAALGRIPAFVDTGLNLVHVDDVAAGHLAALRLGRPGERYILGGQNVMLSTMLRDIAHLVHRPPPRIRLPWCTALPIAVAAEAAARISGREPFATVDGVRLARHRMFFTSAKAEQELGYRARSYLDGLADAVRWFADNGYLPAKPSARLGRSWNPLRKASA